MGTRRQFHLQALTLSAASLGFPTLTRAQASNFPSRPMKVIVPYAAGGGPDVMTRKMAIKLAEAFDKQATVVVDNIVGAGGMLAAQSVARMVPDGYSMMTASSSQVLQKAMQPNVKYDPVKDFVHVTRTDFSPAMLVVNAGSPYQSIQALVAAAKSEPGKLNYASGGIGSLAHLCSAAMTREAGVDVVHIPYKGSVEIIPSILSNATQFACPIASTAIPQIKTGKVRALAVTSAERMTAFPDVPTLAEIFKTQDLALVAWQGIWVPVGTPPDVVDILFQAVVKTYNEPGVRADAQAFGSTVSTSESPAAFTRFVQAEAGKLDKLVTALGLRVGS